MSALSKIDALTAIANGKLVGFKYSDQPDVEVVINKSWSIEKILELSCELYLKIETVNVAGITFTKPLTLEEVEHGDDVYIIQSNGDIHQYSYTECHAVLNQSIARGFAQRDPNNAELQSEALCKLFDRVYRQAQIVEMNTQQVKKTKRSKKADDQAPGVSTSKIQSISVESELQLYLDGIKACNNESEIESTLFNVEKVGFSSEQMLEITMAKESKLAEFSQAVTIILQENVTISEDSLVADLEHQKHLDELLDSAAKAQTPVEANALIRYTKSWTEEQRQPLIIAISKRLGELEQPVHVDPPSLMTRILNAPDLNEISELLAEVRGRHPDIQPKLMGYINQRRFELNNPVDDEPVKIEVA